MNTVSLFYTPQSFHDSSPTLGEQLVKADNQQFIHFLIALLLG